MIFDNAPYEPKFEFRLKILYEHQRIKDSGLYQAKSESQLLCISFSLKLQKPGTCLIDYSRFMQALLLSNFSL